jgi:hypothetical protein
MCGTAPTAPGQATSLGAIMLRPAAGPTTPFVNGRMPSTSPQPFHRVDTVATDLEASLRYCWRQLLCAHELAKPGFMTLCAIRAGGQIVDFEWDYVNSSAARMFLGVRDRMVGQRLLDSGLGRERLLAFCAHYRRVADGLTSETLQHEHVGNGIDGLIRHAAIRLGDGVAVTLSNLTAVSRADALRVELMRHRTQLQQYAKDGSLGQALAALTPATPSQEAGGVSTGDPDEAAPQQIGTGVVPHPPVRGIGRAIRRWGFSAVSDVLAKCRLNNLGALAARSFSAR